MTSTTTQNTNSNNGHTDLLIKTKPNQMFSLGFVQLLYKS